MGGIIITILAILLAIAQGLKIELVMLFNFDTREKLERNGHDSEFGTR